MKLETIKKRIEEYDLAKADLNLRKDQNMQEIQRIVNEHNETQNLIVVDINKIDGKLEMLKELASLHEDAELKLEKE